MKLASFLAAFALVGSIALTYQQGSSGTTAAEVEAKLAPLAAGSSGGLNGTEGTASVAGSLLSVRTDLLWLNNSNASGPWFAKLVRVGDSGLSNIVSLTIGIDNGTSTPQVVGSLGALTQTSGSYVRLEPASANRIYLTQAVSLLGPDTVVQLQVYAADTAAEDAYVVTLANLTVT